MSDERDRFWAELDALGYEEVQRRVAARQWFGPGRRDEIARGWLAHFESATATEDRRKAAAAADEANELARNANVLALEAIEAAREAAESAHHANALAHESNDLARSANAAAEDAAASARRSAEAARSNNTIATVALIAAASAIAVSIIEILIRR